MILVSIYTPTPNDLNPWSRSLVAHVEFSAAPAVGDIVILDDPDYSTWHVAERHWRANTDGGDTKADLSIIVIRSRSA